MMPYAPEHNTDMLIYAANMGGQARHAFACGPHVPMHAMPPLNIGFLSLVAEDFNPCKMGLLEPGIP